MRSQNWTWESWGKKYVYVIISFIFFLHANFIVARQYAISFAGFRRINHFFRGDRHCFLQWSMGLRGLVRQLLFNINFLCFIIAELSRSIIQVFKTKLTSIRWENYTNHTQHNGCRTIGLRIQFQSILTFHFPSSIKPLFKLVSHRNGLNYFTEELKNPNTQVSYKYLETFQSLTAINTW